MSIEQSRFRMLLNTCGKITYLCFSAALMLGLQSCTQASCTGSAITDSASCARQSLRNGEYDRQTAEIRQQAASRENQRNRAVSKGRDLDRKLVSLTAERKALQRRNQTVKSDINQMQARLAQMQRNGTLSGDEAANTMKRLEQLQSRRQLASNNPSDAAAKAEIAKLETEVAELKELIANLA